MNPVDPHDAQRAFQRVARMLSASEQSSAKVRAKLAAAGYDEETVEGAIARARECGILDDARYAEVLVRSTISQNKGFRAAEAELDALGISLEEVDAFREYELEQRGDASAGDLARARALLEAHPPRAKTQRDAAFRKLVSKGYGIDVASQAARWWAEERA